MKRIVLSIFMILAVFGAVASFAASLYPICTETTTYLGGQTYETKISYIDSASYGSYTTTKTFKGNITAVRIQPDTTGACTVPQHLFDITISNPYMLDGSGGTYDLFSGFTQNLDSLTIKTVLPALVGFPATGDTTIAPNGIPVNSKLKIDMSGSVKPKGRANIYIYYKLN